MTPLSFEEDGIKEYDEMEIQKQTYNTDAESQSGCFKISSVYPWLTFFQNSKCINNYFIRIFYIKLNKELLLAQFKY